MYHLKQNNLDTTQANVRLIGELVTSPLAPGKTDVIRRTVEPALPGRSPSP
ncbi:MAG: hypothetical protein HC835_07405 [Oscillatoriales cyanobacterium RM2_1_1]|nr:hypothetical protein [Oscillatoriales cyanobacterium SM2_3_0]NJO45464.1 hypothetical protein [Oscillatoriales cyanobacterium RM2_1_1]